MLEFKPITPALYELFSRYYQYKADNAENSFTNLCAYSFLYQGEYCLYEDTLLSRIHFEYNKQICYYMPMGPKDLKHILNLLIDDSKINDYQLNIVIESPDALDNIIPNQFDVISMRDMYDYLYLRSDLAELKGKKYQPKRNHINQFCNLYKYTFKQLNNSDKASCLAMLKRWREQEMNISPSFKRDYDDEQQVIEYLFDNFDALHIFGGAIIVDDKVVAFSLGSAINNFTFDTHIEKADRDYIGAYALINKEIATNLDTHFQYINREEDKGIIGLRQAKLSYHPYKMVEKYLATLKD